ncbi:unnamed protein product [Bemisia tabaci]|uniref:GDT1 family protein n=1 Tax=Bemisia tabaci TaxID=7038 RepID=A0A9P0AQ16_BEMTA|nr:unnamed protein product [Bemisia tabaci]
MTPYLLCLYLLQYMSSALAELEPLENVGEILLTTSKSHAAGTTEKNPVAANLGFVHAFIASLSVILVSEIGDKTFFIAAIMAMRHPRITVFAGAISALALMTVLSVVFGLAATVIPRVYTYYISILLFFIFGVKMLLEGFKMSPNEAQQELEGVQSDLKRREDELAEEKVRKKSKWGSSSSVVGVSPEDPPTVVPDVKEGSLSINSEKIISSEPIGVKHKSSSVPQFEREALAPDVESGSGTTKIPAPTIKLLSRIVVQAFTLTFLAEWGDRSQLTTIVLAATEDPYGVTAGGIFGHSICTGIAVVGGRFIAQRISVRTVTIIGGIVFLIFAFTSLLFEQSEKA